MVTNRTSLASTAESAISASLQAVAEWTPKIAAAAAGPTVANAAHIAKTEISYAKV